MMNDFPTAKYKIPSAMLPKYIIYTVLRDVFLFICFHCRCILSLYSSSHKCRWVFRRRASHSSRRNFLMPETCPRFLVLPHCGIFIFQWMWQPSLHLMRVTLPHLLIMHTQSVVEQMLIGFANSMNIAVWIVVIVRHSGGKTLILRVVMTLQKSIRFKYSCKKIWFKNLKIDYKLCVVDI